jgi:hypothetical protein
MQERPHIVRLAVGAGCLVCSLHLLGVVIVPGYGGYGSDDASHMREIYVLLVVEIDHADLIVMIAR